MSGNIPSVPGQIHTCICYIYNHNALVGFLEEMTYSFWLRLFLYDLGLHTYVEPLFPPDGQQVLIDLNPESRGKETEVK